MNKQEIIKQLESSHKNFIEFNGGLPDSDFETSVNDKWSPAQHMDHICRAITPLNSILRWPAFIVKLIFGKANRPSKSFEELVNKYNLKLQGGGKASGRFVPAPLKASEKKNLQKKVEKAALRLSKIIDGYTEEQLDRLILPHPLLGRVTLREMMYFTIYHVQHHQALIVRDLNFRNGIAVKETAAVR